MKFVSSLFISLALVGCTATTEDPSAVADEAVESAGVRLFWTEANTVRSARPDGSDPKTVVVGKHPVGVSFDRATNTIVWSDAETNQIVRTGLDGVQHEIVRHTAEATLGAVAIDGLSLFRVEGHGLRMTFGGGPSYGYQIAYSVTGIALDPTADKVYWSDRALDAIVRGNYDQSGVELVYNPDPSPDPASTEDEGVNPSAVAVDPEHRRLYWTEKGAVKSAHLDGTHVATIAKTPNPTGIAVDPKTRKVYFTDSTTDTITSINVDGSARKVIYTTAPGADPRQITVGR
jgi:sugar lactone lactonase YvrE